MNYGKIIYYDTANAQGLSTVLFVSGCTNKCKGCHNKETWDFNYGNEFTIETEKSIIESLNKPAIKNLVISGGDPCHWKNNSIVTKLCKKVKQLYPNINIIIYTGYKFEYLWFEKNEFYEDFFKVIDYLIDGPYMQDLATKVLDYRGSTNQRCFHIKPCPEGRCAINISNEYFKT